MYEQKLIKLTGKKDRFTSIVGDINILLPPIDRIHR